MQRRAPSAAPHASCQHVGQSCCSQRAEAIPAAQNDPKLLPCCIRDVKNHHKHLQGYWDLKEFQSCHPSAACMQKKKNNSSWSQSLTCNRLWDGRWQQSWQEGRGLPRSSLQLLQDGDTFVREAWGEESKPCSCCPLPWPALLAQHAFPHVQN